MMSTDILELCDRVLGEVGRREHRFAWLVAPGAGPGEWLSVDAYYPGRRLVVVLDTAEPLAELCAELIPQHGLQLLRVSSGDLGLDRAAAEPALQQMVATLRLPERPSGAPKPPPRAPVRLEDAFARVAASFASAAAPTPPARAVRPLQAEAALRAARVVAARGPSPPRVRPAPREARPSPPSRSSPRPPLQRRRPPRPAPRSVAVSVATPPGLTAPALGLGLALTVIVAAELYLGVARLGMHSGLWGLALGLAIDACARVLGTVAARRAGAARAAWTCAVAGSPGVALFTLFGSDGPVSVDPAPLAGLLSVLATLLTSGSLLVLLLGI
jgi:hypothetical protein